MANIAAFNLYTDNGNRYVSYLVIEKTINGVRLLNGPIKRQVATPADVTTALAAFSAVLRTHVVGGLVEHHTANAGTIPPPDAFSLNVLSQLATVVATCSGWTLNTQMVQGMAEGTKRKKLKAGLSNLGFWGAVHGTIYEIDLWTTVLHERNPKGCLKVLWRSKQGLLARWKKQEKATYERWYQAL